MKRYTGANNFEDASRNYRLGPGYHASARAVRLSEGFSYQIDEFQSSYEVFNPTGYVGVVGTDSKEPLDISHILLFLGQITLAMENRPKPKPRYAGWCDQSNPVPLIHDTTQIDSWLSEILEALRR